MNKKITYYPEGTCSQMIEIELEGGIIKEVVFIGGCNGNLSGISKLIKGMKAEDVIEKLEGNIHFYGKSGFDYARKFGIRYHDLPEGADDSFFLCKELIPGYLDEVTGVYQTPAGILCG